jgi:hypothetical protein
MKQNNNAILGKYQDFKDLTLVPSPKAEGGRAATFFFNSVIKHFNFRIFYSTD